MVKLLGLVFAGLLGAAQAIYPGDHWTYSTKVTSESHLRELAQGAIDKDQTLFVRWIASPG